MHPSSPTNYQAANKPESKPSEMSPREMIEAAMNATIMELMQLRRTLWLVAKQTGPLVVDEAQCHPLWRLKATREGKTSVRLEAIQLPEPTPEQIAALVEVLHGTKTPLQEAMEPTLLRDHPPAYIEMLLAPKIILGGEGYWVDATLAKLSVNPPNPNN